MTVAAILPLFVWALLAAIVTGPIGFAHFHLGILFGVLFARLRWGPRRA